MFMILLVGLVMGFMVWQIDQQRRDMTLIVELGNQHQATFLFLNSAGPMIEWSRQRVGQDQDNNQHVQWGGREPRERPRRLAR
jgi:hypothetical protein